MCNPATILVVEGAPVLLPEHGVLLRSPRASGRARPDDFHAAFDRLTLYYDVFWHANGRDALLIGPPPVNLSRAYRKARFTAMPSGRDLGAQRFRSLSVMTTRLVDVPAGTTEIAIEFGDQRFVVRVGQNFARQFDGRRMLFGMNRDNDLDWIRFWARWHAAKHGTDAVVLFDNGSTRYSASQLEEVLAGVPGLSVVAVPSWPGPFGRTDPAVKINPYWAHFRQIASMSVVLRRFGAFAEGILNCDIDELATAPEGETVYGLARNSSHGLLSMKGQWVEAVPSGPQPLDHADFPYRRINPDERFCRAGKWAIDPSRPWLSKLSVHPYWHWIEGRPLLAKRYAPGAFFWHFRGISTNWKETRTGVGDDAGLERDAALAEAMVEMRA